MSKSTYKFKLFLFADIEKEEAWINAQRHKHLYLVSIPIGSILYRFREAETDFVPITRIDFREFKNKAAYENYLSLYEDGDWYHIYGNRWDGLQYFRQDNPSGDSILYSDEDSKAQLYLRYAKYLVTLFICFLPIILNLELVDLLNFYTFKSAYLTPGLWQMTGAKFWSAFAFETPFALMRIFSGWLLVILVASFLLGSFINWHRYKKLRDEEASL